MCRANSEASGHRLWCASVRVQDGRQQDDVQAEITAGSIPMRVPSSKFWDVLWRKQPDEHEDILLEGIPAM